MMENRAQFAGHGIQELAVDEIDEVSGGIPLIVAGVLAVYGSEIVFGAGAVAGFAAIMYAAHN